LQQYSTPTFDYERGVSDINLDEAKSRGVNEFGRFLSQRRFSRDADQMSRQFRESQPRFGAQMAQRGMLNSGLMRGGQQERLRGYQDWMGQRAEQGMLEEQQLTSAGLGSDVNRIEAMLRLFEEMQRGRATQDGFAGWQNPLAGLGGMG